MWSSKKNHINHFIEIQIHLEQVNEPKSYVMEGSQNRRDLVSEVLMTLNWIHEYSCTE